MGLRGQVTTHSPRKTYAKVVYERSGSDLLVAQRALRHTNVQTTLAYLETLSDDVRAAMPNFDFEVGVEFDIQQETSSSDVIELPGPARRRGGRRAGGKTR